MILDLQTSVKADWRRLSTSTLAGFEATLRLVNDVEASATPHNLTIPVADPQRLD